MPKKERKTKSRKAAKNPAKQAAILKAAEKIFAIKGFHEARISDIAREAHVSESTIYEYFSTKEELLFSIPAEIIGHYQKTNQEILQYTWGAANKLRTMIHRHLSLYAYNEDYANVIMLILKGNRNFLQTEAYKVVQASARVTTQVLEEGIKTGEFRPTMKPHLVRAMIWGTIEHLVVRRSLLGKPEDLLSLADDITDTILNGIIVPKAENTLNVNVLVTRKD
jgi:TetR/AcrR family transcriptional regulator, fatty acid metabolism regulator protein